MPCPVFSTGEKMVMQRGAGICTVKSTPDKEKACITFLKWLTETRKNVEFVTSLGYMPVKQEAFDACLPEAIKELSDPMYVSLYQLFWIRRRIIHFIRLRSWIPIWIWKQGLKNLSGKYC